MCLWLREFLGRILLSCWLNVRSTSESPNFSPLLMINNVTAVHSLHCWAITWDISPDTCTHKHIHTQSTQRWKGLSKLFSYCSLSLLLGRGHFVGAPEDVDSEWRRALWVALRSKVITGSSETRLLAAFHSPSSLSCQRADRRRRPRKQKSIKKKKNNIISRERMSGRWFALLSILTVSQGTGDL